MKIVGLDHVQVAIPVGSEDEARAFYVRILGLHEIPKAPELADRGGLWLECGAQQIHLGVEQDFRPARKAHPAFVVEGLADLTRTLAEHGCEVKTAEELPGIRRCHVADPFGNRIELLEKSEE
jgi:catechol 2,3-dioxygenase-like lactoylglutathione lyase family enzyme